MKVPTVALVGRPNVGKSTVFNRLVKKRIAIIDDFPGVTRDRLYADAEYKDYKYKVIDTGGIEVSKDFFNKEIIIQAEIAIEEADVIVFIVDGKEGLTANDLMVKDILRKSNKKVIVAINKIDNKKVKENIYDFYELGFDTYIAISSEHNEGIGELLDNIIASFEKIDLKEELNLTKFCVVGRPNVGKSSLVNALLNEERVIVSSEAGTTRDAIDTYFSYGGNEYIAIDTAGIRRKGKVYEKIEKYSVLRALKAIDRSDVCVLVINAEEGIIEQDKHIASYILEAGKAVVIVVNKWDKADNQNKGIKEFSKVVKNEFQFMTYAPIVFLSAMTRRRIHTLIPQVILANNNAKQELQTSLINNVIQDAVSLNPPPSYKGKRLKIYYVNQIGIGPPKFLFSVNNKGLIHFSYERYIENKLRESFDLKGTPIIMQFKNRGEKQ